MEECGQGYSSAGVVEELGVVEECWCWGIRGRSAGGGGRGGKKTNPV